MSKILSFKHVVNIKIIKEIFIVFFVGSLKNLVCILYFQHISVHSDIFQVLSGHIWLVATVLHKLKKILVFLEKSVHRHLTNA